MTSVVPPGHFGFVAQIFDLKNRNLPFSDFFLTAVRSCAMLDAGSPKFWTFTPLAPPYPDFDQLLIRLGSSFEKVELTSPPNDQRHTDNLHELKAAIQDLSNLVSVQPALPSLEAIMNAALQAARAEAAAEEVRWLARKDATAQWIRALASVVIFTFIAVSAWRAEEGFFQLPMGKVHAVGFIALTGFWTVLAIVGLQILRRPRDE